MDDGCIPLKVKSRLGCSIVNADATRIERDDPDDHDYPNVLILTIRRTLLDSIFFAIISVLLWPLVITAKALFPSLFLPQRVILKKQKDSREDEFEHEKSMYDMLRDLHGHWIPICYGEGRYEGSRALLLPYVDGRRASSVVDIDPADFRRLLRETFSAFFPYKAVPGDLKLNNFIFSEQRIIVLDLEHLDVVGVNSEDMEYDAKSSLDMLMRYYKINQENAIHPNR